MKKIGSGLLVVIMGLGVVLIPSISSVLINENFSQKITDINDLKGELNEEKDQGPGKDKDPFIKATIDINPNKLNCKSEGKWVTAFIGLASPNNPENIDIASIILTVSSDNMPCAPNSPYAIADINGDNEPELMVKFDRSTLIAYFELYEPSEISVEGNLYNGDKFKGSCAIEIINLYS